MAARKNPIAAEALGDKIAFNYNGADYFVTSTEDWDYEVLEAFEDGKIVTFLRLILGTEQHAAFKATKPKVADVNAFVEAIQKALGIQGN